MKKSTQNLLILLASSMCFNLLIAGHLAAQTQHMMTCVVRSIIDGDTVRVLDSSQKEQKIRLYGIDSPEPGQPYGDEATAFLKSLIDGQEVTLLVTGNDRYNRIVAIILKDSQDICLKMINNGHAWAYRKYLEGDRLTQYVEAEISARKKKLGMWKTGNPTEPWEYRKRKK